MVGAMTTLSHVLWIGGPSATGKTLVATQLGRRHGLRWYSADKQTWEHRDVAIAAGHEAATRWETMTHEERAATLAANPAEFLKLNLDFERGPMILDDLRRLPPAPLVVADGSTVLPELVAQGHAERDRAVWLLPTFELHRAFHEKRGMAHLVEYRWLVAEEIERQAAELSVSVLRVDDTVGIDEAVAAVEELFAEALAEGPRAETVEERRALLRYANEAVVTQARGFLARPWTRGDEATFVREFLCECDDPECTEVVELAVAEYAPCVSARR
jgi:hypothetical protein